MRTMQARRRGSLARGLVVVCTVAVSAFLAASASAGLDLGPTTGVDTHYTPVAKEPPPGLFTQVAGSLFNEKDPQSPTAPKGGSVTPPELDLLAVSFADRTKGFAAGMRCPSGQQAKACTEDTVPALYSYTESDGWRLDSGFEPKGTGFIAAIAWIDGERALAVGGDGRYPEREEPGANCAGGGDPGSDPAGNARAWLYEKGSWRELRQRDDGEDGDELPDTMRALTALDFYVSDPDKPVEFGMAGGLCQLWHWADGGFLRDGETEFEPPFSSEAPAGTRIEALTHRVRTIAISRLAARPAIDPEERLPHAYAATAGCCSAEQTEQPFGQPVLLEYTPPATGHPARGGSWIAQPRDRELRAKEPDSYVSVTNTRSLFRECCPSRDVARALPPGLVSTPLGPKPEDEQDELLEPGSTVGTERILGVNRVGVGNFAAEYAHDRQRPTSPSLRLNAADGDLGGGEFKTVRKRNGSQAPGSRETETGVTTIGLEPAIGSAQVFTESSYYWKNYQFTDVNIGGRQRTFPDGIPDWAVGEMTTDGRGVVLGTDPGQLPANSALDQFPQYLDCFTATAANPIADNSNDTGGTPQNSPAQRTDCQVGTTVDFAGGSVDQRLNSNANRDADRAQQALRSQHLYSLPSYALNGVDYQDDSLQGWAVGDRGAIVKIEVDRSTVRSDETPADTGAGAPTEFEPDDELRLMRPATTTEPGVVPPLSSRLPKSLPQPKTEHVDTVPGEITTLETSRDGEEGFAFPGPYHYDGAWRNCAAGIRDDASDPSHDACKNAPAEVIAVARVPVEADEDPGNDDDFELVAIVEESYTGPNDSSIVRYRDGRWLPEPKDILPALRTSSVETVSRQLVDVAFTAPDDGWIVTKTLRDNVLSPQDFFHFDGKRWTACVVEPSRHVFDTSDCDPHERLPSDKTQGRIVGLNAAPGRLFTIGERRVTATAKTGNAPTDATIAQQSGGTLTPVPLVVSRARGDDGWPESPSDYEYDPGFDGKGVSALQVSRIEEVAVARRSDGAYEGWATGVFDAKGRLSAASAEGETFLFRISPGQPIRPFHDTGGLEHDPHSTGAATAKTYLAAASPARDGAIESYVANTKPHLGFGTTSGYVFEFNRHRSRWDAVEIERPPSLPSTTVYAQGRVTAVAPDGRGGAWTAVHQRHGLRARTYLYRYTDSPREPVFTEVPRPQEEPRHVIRAMAAATDGTVWAATATSALYRYVRARGWDRMRIPGWDPSRSVVPSEANAIAVLEDGSEGVVVGKRGRIATIRGSTVQLDAATGTVCASEPEPPCGTGRDLLAAAIAPDGSALAGGVQSALLYRPPGGQFRRIAPPPNLAAAVAFTGVAMVGGSRAYLTTRDGQIFAGALNGGEWRWTLEQGASASRLSAISLDRQGRGYAVGDGTILERTGGAGEPWRRHSKSAVALATMPGDGRNAIFGTASGEIFTRTDRGFEVARPGEFPWPVGITSAPRSVNALALAPGFQKGEVEAWAALSPLVEMADTAMLLHHSTDPANPLLTPRPVSQPLPDVPAARPDELTIAALGRTDCQRSDKWWCPPMLGLTDFAERIARRSVAEIVARGKRPGGPAIALFTGDATGNAGHAGNAATQSAMGHRESAVNPIDVGPATGGPGRLRRWKEAIADRLTDGGVPMLSALGRSDLSSADACYTDTLVYRCPPTGAVVPTGENLVWREAAARPPAAWRGDRGETPSRYNLRPVGVSRGPGRHSDVRVSDPDGEGPAPAVRLPSGGGPTHYATDLRDPDSNEPVARVIVLDSSLRSLAAADAIQQPLEPDGGQTEWLRKMLCFKGDTSLTYRCSRAPGQKAIVLTNSPTYSYGPGAVTDTAADGTAIEALLVTYRASLLVSGRIGWNGLYWVLGPGVHEPCPGGDYPAGPPGGQPGCVPGPAAEADPSRGYETVAGGLANALGSVNVGAPAPPATPAPIPAVVASGGGGPLATQDGTAAEGFWHGYTVVRLDKSGDTRKTVIEQRPIYDWVGVEAAARTLRPGQKMKLRGFARSPIGTLAGNYPPLPVVRTDRIDGEAVTHRYDLVEAEPDKPWLARRDAEGTYRLLDPSIATIDRTTGAIRAGRGNHPRARAIALLSVGDHVASYPLTFEPRRTFVPKAGSQPAQTSRVIVQSAQAGIAPPASPGTPPQVGAISPPVLPSFPSVQPPPVTPPIGQPTPSPPPPPPPAPPPPAPLALATAPPGLTVAPPAAVIPPPAPPINPAPPGGARKEARQRQAATEKSGSGSGESEGKHDVDMAEGPPEPRGSAMTRRERQKASPSFTVMARPEQPSAWARGATYGGGLTLMALAMAGFWTARPRPRPRPPAVPAPARSYISRR